MSIATKFKSVARNRKAVIFAASTVSGIGGAIAGYKYAERMLNQKYADISDKEIAAAREHYTRVFKDGEWADPSVIAEKYEEATEKLEELEEESDDSIRLAAELIERSGHVPYNKPQTIPEQVVVVPVVEKVVKNVFVEHASDDEDSYDVEAESAKKRAGRPYIVEYDEFEHNEEDKTKQTLTWYAEDGILVDENDRGLSPDQMRTTIGGEENLRFGYGSGDPNVVYIYNDKLDAALEVTRDEGAYRNIVLGLNDHLEHSDRRADRGLRKMRPDD